MSRESGSGSGTPWKTIVISALVGTAGFSAGLFVNHQGRAAEPTDVSIAATQGVEATEEPIAGPQADATEPAPEEGAPTYDYDAMDQYITFETPSAEAAVRNFDIQCPQPGKSINLMDVLRAAERQATGPKGTPLYTTVESRDDELRVYHQIRLADGRHNEPHVVMTVNKWDELQFFGITKAAVMTTCYL